MTALFLACVISCVARNEVTAARVLRLPRAVRRSSVDADLSGTDHVNDECASAWPGRGGDVRRVLFLAPAVGRSGRRSSWICRALDAGASGRHLAPLGSSATVGVHSPRRTMR
jgi:hypothetical protein